MNSKHSIYILLTLRSILICLLFIPLSAFNQSAPGLSFGGHENDHAYAVCLCEDGGYLLAGTTRSYGAGSEDIYLIRLDKQGQLIWSGTFGGSRQDYSRSVMATDGGFIITGDTWIDGRRKDLLMRKIDGNGLLVWEKQFGTTKDEKGFQLLETANGDFVALGYSRGSEPNGDIYIVRTDHEGDLLWENHYGYENDDYAMDLVENDDGSLMIFGSKSGFFDDVHVNYRDHDADMLLLKLDANGNEMWRKLYGLEGHDFGYAIEKTSDGFYLFGSSQSYGAGSFDMLLSKLDEAGNEAWHQSYGGENYEYGCAMDANEIGDLFLFGSSSSFGVSGSADFYLLKTDAMGSKLWELTIGGDQDDFGHAVIATADSGCVVVGSSKSYGTANFDVLLVKINKNGQIEHLIDGIELIYEQQIVVVPNPVQDKGRILLDANNKGFTRILELTAMNGGYSRKMSLTGPDFSFDVSSLATGVYAYKLYATDATATVYSGKLIVY